VHWGLEGLAATNKLVEAARRFDDSFVLRDELYRIAMTPQNAQQLQATAERLPTLCEWSGYNGLGSLRLHDGCKVIHAPTYLQALWKACMQLAEERGCTASWSITNKVEDIVGNTVVYAAGDGLFQPKGGILTNRMTLPVQLVRGQSLELKMPEPQSKQPALMCGKYISPLPDPNFVLVGATHEFKEEAMSLDQVVKELRERTYGVSPSSWDNGKVHRLTSGTRVQSERGQNGRLPIIGRLSTDAWIFTGLSSRGLLYHGIYGEILADAILEDSEDAIWERCEDLSWWKSKFAVKKT
jgi:glycine/D-amino acid oxidase-like deaminating enzyme